MRDLLTKNWHVMRWVRIAIALFLFSQAFILKDWMFFALGIFFFIQALFNLGCSSNGCAVPTNKYTKNE